MLQFVKSLFGARKNDLRAYLNETKVVWVNGIRFKIRRLNLLDVLDGAKTLTAYFDLYKVGKTNEIEQSQKKIAEHYKDVFMAAVIEPKLIRKEDPGSDDIFVGEITNDLILSGYLYAEIMAFTEGKKKVKFARPGA